MPSSSIQCDPDLLRRSLNDELTEQQEEQLAAHLAECRSCQQQLEQFAGSKDDWTRIGKALVTEQRSGSEFLRPVTNTQVDDSHAHAGVQQFIADFAVDFLEPCTAPDALGQLGNIEIREIIGHGGNGIVLKGFQPELNRLVAAKVMAPHLATSAAARQRFAREAQATAAIVHPGVLPILSVNSEGRLPYLVMPYVDCESLQQRIDREGALPVIDVLRIGLQVARGLAAAHAQGLVHRDVKPANILLEKGVDRVMLTDFGLARAVDDASLTRSGLIAGTPQYMSPEQARGDAIDARSDLFSLGSVLYAMSTGRPPFRAETSYGILRRVTDDEPRSIREINADVPGWLEAFVGRLLGKSPEERFDTAETVARLLEDCVAHVQQPIANPLPSTIRSLDRSHSGQSMTVRRWAVAGGALAVGLVLTVIAVTLPRQSSESQPIELGPQVVTANQTTFGDAATDDSIPAAKSESNAASGDSQWDSTADQELQQLDQELDQLLNEVEANWNP